VNPPERDYTLNSAPADRGEVHPGSGHLTPLEEENRTLRADVKRLEMDEVPQDSWTGS
jgi:hypothetical protein